MNTTLYPLVYLISQEMEQTCCLVWDTAREIDGVSVDDPAIDLALLKLRRDIPVSYEAALFDINGYPHRFN